LLIFIVDIDETGGDSVVKEIVYSGGTASFHKADVSKEKEVVDACAKEFHSIDFAYNNAGIIICATTATCTEEIWQMLRQGHGNIVNTSSISGLIGRSGDMPYNVSKHGIIGLTKTAALETAKRNIRINCVCPGAIQTSWVKKVTDKLNAMQPMNRIGQPEKVANAVLWFCSDASSFITGYSLVIGGGQIAGE
jgi:NAD(P)-dependent dehydrogenase (short-subunit alcohol dehydrogenase family)